MLKHTGKTMEKPLQCKYCDKAFPHNAHLNDIIAHQRTHTSEKTFQCNYCEMKLSSKNSLVCHERRHTEEKPYHCNYCEESFAIKKELKLHKLLHNREKAYRCTICDMAFSDKKNLSKHLKTHTEEKPYECTECGKTFKRNDQLITHHRLHTGEKPYQCSICEQSFRIRSSLREHLNIHTGEKPHICTHCSKAFFRQKQLKQHISTHHLGKLYPCSQCNSTFSQNDNLRKHMKIHTNQKESNQSINCGKANHDNFLKKYVLQKSIHINHLKTHTNSHGIWLGRVRQCHTKTTDCTSKQKPKSKGDNISDKISTSDKSSIPLFCDDSTKVILWFQQNKLLKSVMSCDSCCNLMNWSESSRSRDGFEWICQTKACMKYQQGVCIKLGSFFNHSRVTLPDWFDIMYLWSENVKAKVLSNFVDVSHTQIMDCYASFREVCWAYFIENPIKLGGPGIIIEIEVARFSGNSESNQVKPHIMVLGIIESNSNPLKGYMEIVESSDAATLFPILLNVVKPGSIIYSKDSKEFRKAQGRAEVDTIVNHSINFLDINTSEHVANIQSFWDINHNNINDIHGCKQMYQNSYVQELMWRDRFYDDSFKRLCQHISDQYPL